MVNHQTESSRGDAMKRLLILACVAIAGIAAVAYPATARTSSAKSKAAADRVTADVWVQVVQLVDLGNPSLKQLGIAHVQVSAHDVDPASPLSTSGQTADQGSVTCTPALSAACSVLPTRETPILWVDFTSSPDPGTVTISVPTAPSSSAVDFLVLHDGGSQGNRLTHELGSSGAPLTSDWLRWGDWRGRPSFEARVLVGKVKIHRD
jgi:hypothetical protein